MSARKLLSHDDHGDLIVKEFCHSAKWGAGGRGIEYRWLIIEFKCWAHSETSVFPQWNFSDRQKNPNQPKPKLGTQDAKNSKVLKELGVCGLLLISLDILFFTAHS